MCMHPFGVCILERMLQRELTLFVGGNSCILAIATALLD
jgi:hypothetical protein